jgi:hypothetical protein
VAGCARCAAPVGATATSFSGWRRKASSKGLADGLELSRFDESAFLQLVANHVNPISEINPRREGAAESRLQFVTPAESMNVRGAASFLSRGCSVSAEVIGEIDCGFLDIFQLLQIAETTINSSETVASRGAVKIETLITLG